MRRGRVPSCQLYGEVQCWGGSYLGRPGLSEGDGGMSKGASDVLMRCILDEGVSVTRICEEDVKHREWIIS